jgi:E3 ubiquitin-protein ligase TRIP12
MIVLQVFDVTSLQIFSPHELDYLICGRRELWEAIYYLNFGVFYLAIKYLLSDNENANIFQADTLVDHIKFDHGYTAKSLVIVNVRTFLFSNCKQFLQNALNNPKKLKYYFS